MVWFGLLFRGWHGVWHVVVYDVVKRIVCGLLCVVWYVARGVWRNGVAWSAVRCNARFGVISCGSVSFVCCVSV